MQLTPRYGADPVMTLDGPPNAIAVPAIRQRRRLAAALAELTDAQWASQSRCSEWTARDVIAHLEPTNSFWSFSISAGVRGTPSTFLTTFDPVASPAQMVAGGADRSAAEVFEGFVATNDAFIATIESLDEAGWSALAEAPPGHISVSALVHHALWDCWIHERDVLVPLGIEPALEADEIDACLRYVAALAPSFALTRGEARTGSLAVVATDPDVSFALRVGTSVSVTPVDGSEDVRLTGDAVELLEALSFRAPFAPDVPVEHRWLLDGLAATFDQA